MNTKLSLLFGVILLFLFANSSFAQEIKVSEDLVLHQLSENCYVHTQKGNNGLIYVNNNEAVIISTPDSDRETQNLINWVQNELKATIVAYVIDRWHPDAMQGLDVVQENGIKSYAFELTRKIAKEKGLPVPEIGFNLKKELMVGDEKVVCHFLGEAHTRDGIVVWIPSEKILFGGNEIRSYNGWVGNIGDANLEQWSKTAKKIKQAYGAAKIVVPGHGRFGGSELIDYTIELFNLSKNELHLNDATDALPNLNTTEEPYIMADSISIQDGNRILQNATLIVQDEFKIIVIKSPTIKISEKNNKIDSEQGKLKIYDKKPNGDRLRTNVNYQKLNAYPYHEPTVGYVVILKAFEKSNR